MTSGTDGTGRVAFAGGRGARSDPSPRLDAEANQQHNTYEEMKMATKDAAPTRVDPLDELHELARTWTPSVPNVPGSAKGVTPIADKIRNAQAELDALATTRQASSGTRARR